jgi:hypothetical protein
MKHWYYLLLESDSIEEAIKCPSVRSAKTKYSEIARELDRYGQSIDATVHISASRSAIEEYPDYILSIGPRGGVRVERA